MTAFNKETSKKGFHFFRKDCWAAHHNHRSSGNLDTAEQDEFGENLVKELRGKRGKEKMGEFFSLPCVAPASQARGQFASVGEIWHFFCIWTKKSSVSTRHFTVLAKRWQIKFFWGILLLRQNKDVVMPLEPFATLK